MDKRNNRRCRRDDNDDVIEVGSSSSSSSEDSSSDSEDNSYSYNATSFNEIKVIIFKLNIFYFVNYIMLFY